MTSLTAPRTTMPKKLSMEIMSPSRDDQVGAGDGGSLAASIFQRLHTAHARRAHAAGDNGRVAHLAAMGGEDALGGDHAGQVIGVGLPARARHLQPASAAATASAAEKTASPTAAPGLAFRPRATTS